MPEPPEAAPAGPDAGSTTDPVVGPEGTVVVEPARPRRRARRVVIASALAVVIAAWGYALVYDVAKPTPEPLDAPSHAIVADACASALHDLRALPAVTTDASETARADRVTAEDAIFRRLVAGASRARPPSHDGATALRRWLDDWRGVVRARETFATNLRAGNPKRLVFPVDGQGRPVTVRMGDWADIHDLSGCTPQALQLEVVDGARFYSQ